jgi:hypothetical protein
MEVEEHLMMTQRGADGEDRGRGEESVEAVGRGRRERRTMKR